MGIMGTPAEKLAHLIDEYRARGDRAGREYKCLCGEGERKEALSVTKGENATTVRIQGPMDDFVGVPARQIIQALDEAEEENEIVVLVDSPGGMVTEGLALYADLRARAAAGVKIRTEARGLVASAATLPFLAGDERVMGDGSMIMVHEPFSCLIACGSAESIRKTSAAVVNALTAHSKNYAGIVANRTFLTKAKAAEVMAAETWYSAEEAIADGYADKVTEAKKEDDDAKATASAVGMRVAEAAIESMAVSLIQSTPRTLATGEV